MKIISVKVDVSKIDKSRLYKGEKGTYLSLTGIIKDEKDKYGNDVSVWEEQSKEEREAKKDRNFLGNGKVVFSEETKPASPEEKNDLPF